MLKEEIYMTKRKILILFLLFIVTPATAYIAIEYLPVLGPNSQSTRASVAIKSIAITSIPTTTTPTPATPTPTPHTPTSTPTTAAPNTETNTTGSNTCDNLLVLVDKTHGLPQDYAPADRVHFIDYTIPVIQTAAAGRLIMINDLQRLFVDSKSAGIDLKVVSAYRSYDLQASVYASYVQQYGVDKANTFSAQPGHSQHQLGTAIDFSTQEINYDINQGFANTKAGQWLQANAYKYGFYIAYPEGQDSVTGYEFEPWHYRYIGVQNALNLQQSGLIMQTYLQKYGVLPNCA